MRRTLLAFMAGVAVASGGAFAFASPGGRDSTTTTPPPQIAHPRRITLHGGDRLFMPELRWECSYFLDGFGLLSGAPPGPELHCGRLGALTGGIRTTVDLYYVVVSRGTNSAPRILLKARRP